MNKHSRRQFLQKSIKLGAGLAGLALVATCFSEDGPPSTGASAQERIFDFRLEDNGPALSMAKGRNRSAMLNACLRELGGIERFVAPGDRVLLKVNAGFASPPAIGATTNPELLGSMIDLCRQAGAAEVVVSDNPITDPTSCFALNGLAAASRLHGARLLVPTPADFSPVSLPGGRLIQNWPFLLAPLQGITKVIGLAPIKDHVRAQATMGLKNWYGLLGGRRGVFHQDIHRIVLELAQLIRPTLSVLDGVQTMTQNGPTGGSLDDLADTNTMIAGTDPVAVDALGAGLLGLAARDIGYLQMCAAAGLGSINPAMPAAREV